MQLEIVFWLVAYSLALAFFIVPFLLFPKQLVSWLGHFYRRWYKGYLEMPDGVIDKFPRLPTDTYLGGSRSQFVNRAPEHPEEFPRLILAYRLIGCFFAGLWILGIALLIWGAATGRLIIVR